MTYIFRRTDNGELVEVDWATMMEQKDGEIILPDGVPARRCVYLEDQRKLNETPKKTPIGGEHAEIVSDVLGVTAHQVEEFREAARKDGFTGVNFTPDPHEPTFYQCRVSSVEEWRRYIKSRGLVDQNSTNGGGASLTPQQFEQAKRLVERELEERNMAILGRHLVDISYPTSPQ